MSGGPPVESRTLLETARDLELVARRHAPALRSEGQDDLAEQLEELVLLFSTSAQELQAALEPTETG
jgi:hypothetical protein